MDTQTKLQHRYKLSRLKRKEKISVVSGVSQACVRSDNKINRKVHAKMCRFFFFFFFFSNCSQFSGLCFHNTVSFENFLENGLKMIYL